MPEHLAPVRARAIAAAAAAAVAIACGGPRAAPVAPDEPAAAAAPAVEAPADATGAAITPRAYHLELAIDPDEVGYTGTIAIDVDVAARASAIVLHARDLQIEGATLTAGGGEVALAAAPGADDRLVLTAPRPVEPGDARVEIRFAGAYRGDDGIFVQGHRGRRYVFSDFQPIDARRAFPCFDEPRFKTPWTVALVVPGDAVALANAPARATTRLADGRARVEFEPTPPLPSYLVALAVGPFELVAADGGPVPIRIAAPAGRGGAVTWARAHAPELLEVARRLVDQPVPVAKLDVVAVPRFGGAMENPGLFTVAADILLDGGGAAGERLRGLVLAHEIAHLWFGDSVTLADWRDLWINEGLASWMADEVLAAWRPAWRTRRDELRARFEAMRDDDLPGAHPLRPERLDGPRALFDLLTYQKSAAVLHMIEDWVGPERFVAALRGYLAAHAGGSVSTDDVRAALAPLGDEVDAALAGLLAAPGVPHVDAELRCGGGAATLRLAARTRDGGAAPWAVPACARWHDGARLRRACAVVGEPAELALGDRCPTWVHPNADGSGYYRWTLAGASLAAAVGGAHATERERIDAAHAIRGALAAGAPLADVAAALAAAAASPVPEVVEAALADYELTLALAPAEARPAIAAHLAAAVAPARRRLGTAPRAGEDDDDRRVRLLVLRAAGELAGDRATVRWARREARRWLADPRRGEAAALAEVAVRIAAAHADDALADALAEVAARATDDPLLDPAAVARALGRLPRARALAALDAALAGGLPAGATFALAVELLGRPELAADAADALARGGDWVGLAVAFAAVCDPAIVDRVLTSGAGAAARDHGFGAALERRRVEAVRCAALAPRLGGAARAFRP